MAKDQNFEIHNHDNIEEENSTALPHVTCPASFGKDVVLQDHEDHENREYAIQYSLPNVLKVYNCIEIEICQSWMIYIVEYFWLLPVIFFIENGIDDYG